MEVVMQTVVRLDSNPEVFAIQLDTTIRVLRLTGAKRIEVIQLGEGGVLVLAFRSVTREEEANMEEGAKAGAEGVESHPLRGAFDEHATTALMLEVVAKTLGMSMQQSEKMATVVAVDVAKGWAPSTLGLVYDDLARFGQKILENAKPDDALEGAGWVVVAVLEGLHLLQPALRN